MKKENYTAWLSQAMQSVIKQALESIIINNYKPNLLITFLTRGNGVELSKDMMLKYPKQMTVVLQNKFDNLKIFENKFTVMLSFNKIPEEITVPFCSITNFLDRDCNFALELIPMGGGDPKDQKKDSKIINFSECLKNRKDS